MKKLIVFIFFVVMVTIAGKAQNSYRISGKITGIPDGKLLLITEESGRPDTLAKTNLVNGAFVFTGKVESPMAVYITGAGQEGTIPLILENVNYMMNVGKTGALIQGGKQQEIFNLFSRNNMKLLQTQNWIQQEFQQAEQTGNKNGMQTLRKQFEEAIINARQEEEEIFLPSVGA